MGDKLVKLDGKPVMGWSNGMLDLFEEEQDRFEVGMEFSWPQMLFIMASWWECLKHKECPARVLSTLKKHARRLGCNIEDLQEQVDETVYDIDL